MATRIGYFGNPSNSGDVLFWNADSPIISCLKKNSSATYRSATAKYPSDNQVITLDNDEYLTGISFNTDTLCNMATTYNNAALSLCDSEGQNVHVLFEERSVPGTPSGVSPPEGVAPSIANKSGQTWTNLKGKTIALKKVRGGTWGIYWPHHTTVTLTTAYTGYNITLMTSGAGTATLAATSLLRGESTTLTVTPASGYKIDHIDVSHGTIVRNSVNVFTFTMPTPGEASTITVYFKPFTARAKVGGIIYADWYNQ